MNRSDRKKRARAGRAAAASEQPPAPDQIRLLLQLPGVLGYRLPLPPGIPDSHTIRAAHIRTTAAGPVFSKLDNEEREAVFESLAKTYRRAQYHRLRFVDLRGALDERRKNLPGEVFFDELVECLHFELQAFCGAARMLVDELVYVIARRHGAKTKNARCKPWVTSSLVKNPLAVSSACDVPEIAILRNKKTWFDLLNAYRNQVFHHGWRHGSGHFAQDDARGAAKSPVSNALLVPDRASLEGKSKPFEWTYKAGTTVDDVVRDSQQGLDDLLKELCEGPWATPEPRPGRVPRSEQPNLMVTLAMPALFQLAGDVVTVPFFSSESAGHTFRESFPGESLPWGDVELVSIPVSTAVVGRAAVTFSLRGVKSSALPPSAKFLRALLDPIGLDADWLKVSYASQAQVSVREITKPKFPPPISLPIDGHKEVFAWVAKSARPWVIPR